MREEARRWKVTAVLFLRLQCNRSLPRAACDIWLRALFLMACPYLPAWTERGTLEKHRAPSAASPGNTIGASRRVRGLTSCFLSVPGHQRVLLRGIQTTLSRLPFVLGPSQLRSSSHQAQLDYGRKRWEEGEVLTHAESCSVSIVDMGRSETWEDTINTRTHTHRYEVLDIYKYL